MIKYITITSQKLSVADSQKLTMSKPKSLILFYNSVSRITYFYQAHPRIAYFYQAHHNFFIKW